MRRKRGTPDECLPSPATAAIGVCTLNTADAQSLFCFDFGTTRIGLAVGQTVTQTASPLTELSARDGIPNWNDIETLLREWKPDRVLVGLPLNMDGSESALSARARKFAQRLHGRFGVTVEMVDERLSSFEAKGKIIEQTGSRNFKQRHVDSVAATLILESWFQRQQKPAPLS